MRSYVYLNSYTQIRDKGAQCAPPLVLIGLKKFNNEIPNWLRSLFIEEKSAGAESLQAHNRKPHFHSRGEKHCASCTLARLPLPLPSSTKDLVSSSDKNKSILLNPFSQLCFTLRSCGASKSDCLTNKHQMLNTRLNPYCLFELEIEIESIWLMAQDLSNQEEKKPCSITNFLRFWLILSCGDNLGI